MAGIEGTNEAPANLLAEVADDNRHIRMSDAQYAFWGSVVEAVDATVPVVEPFCPRDFLTPEVRVTLPASYFHFLSVRYRTLLETDDIVELDSKYHRSLVPENEYNPSVKHVQDLKQALIERRLYPNETRMATFSGSGPTRAAVHEAMASPAAMDAYVRKIDGMVHINRVYTAAWPELAGGLIAALDQLGSGRLKPLPRVRLGPLARFIAAFHIGDPISPSDSWRPGARRGILQKRLEALRPGVARTD